MERWGLYEALYGKVLAGAIPLRTTDVQLLKDLGIRGVVDLNFKSFDLTAEYSKHNIEYLNLPIVDLRSSDLETVDKFIAFYHEFKPIYLHCHVGEGRTGMMLACLLISEYNLSPKEAVELVRQRKRLSIHTQEQMDLIYQYAEYLNRDFDMERIPVREKYRPIALYSVKSIKLLNFKLESPDFEEVITIEFFTSSKFEEQLLYHKQNTLDIFLSPVAITDIEKLRKVVKLSVNPIKVSLTAEYAQTNDKVPTYNNKFTGIIEGLRFKVIEEWSYWRLDDKEGVDHITYDEMRHTTHIVPNVLKLQIALKVDQSTPKNELYK